ncbi:Hypothetical protein CpOVID04_1582 [Corynebacterium pseudotuberculosis]|nr:hypothetical protein CpPA04_1559 [Corynebacterium pseudotuberculosis]ATQ65881.1 Hypothetical protein CpPA07_1584 [Corynebacterium pseudotuberculosis]QBG77735.1 Hypothetical protein CpCAP1R_1565 [Corynebacterium pseudotuberculosis]QBI73451.1 Hypothetical protein Cp38MAT_1576 [Corynebacterium pseudotuberculosis]QBK60969.1 Hypothetical protein CpE7_1582 [Corynebacterium pseudotuberculosis]
MGKRSFFLRSLGGYFAVLRTLASSEAVKQQDKISSALRNHRVRGRNKNRPFSFKATKEKGRKRL